MSFCETEFVAMKFGTRHVLWLTALVALQLSLRSYWVSMGMPAQAGLIPISLAAAVSIYLSWTRRPTLVVGLSAGATAMLSAGAIATEVCLESTATSFLPTEQTAPMPNVVAVAAITFVCTIIGAILAYLYQSLVASRGLSRLSWLTASMAFLLALASWYLSFSGVSDANAKRLHPTMHQQEVEAILGSPNPLPGLGSKSEAFWDAYTYLGRRYVSIHVAYDGNKNVSRVDHNGFWTTRSWLYW